MSKTIVTFILLFSCISKAGFRRGNGGDILECSDKKTKSYQMLDLFEATERYHWHLATVSGKDEYEKAQTIIDRLKHINPTRYQLYSQWLKSFRNESEFITGMKIVDIDDVGATYIPNNCTLKQMIIQVEPIDSTEKRFTINKDLWNKLNLDHRAAAIMHELIYREAINFENQHNSSEPSRRLNAFLNSTSVSTTSLKSWLLLLQGLGFHRADAQGTEVRLNSFADTSYSSHVKSNLSFFDDNHLVGAQLPYKSTFDVLGTKNSYECVDNLVDIPMRTPGYSYYPNGRIKEIYFSRIDNCYEFTLKIDKKNTLGSIVTVLSAPAKHIAFDEHGNLAYVLGGDLLPFKGGYLEIQGDHILLERNFTNMNSNDGYQFIIEFKNNSPILLNNEIYNDDLSGTYERATLDADLKLIPNSPVQKIY